MTHLTSNILTCIYSIVDVCPLDCLWCDVHVQYSMYITFPLDFVFSEGGYFKAHLIFPKEYPQRPPKMKFITEIWHPNGDCIICILVTHKWVSSYPHWIIIICYYIRVYQYNVLMSLSHTHTLHHFKHWKMDLFVVHCGSLCWEVVLYVHRNLFAGSLYHG